jgi:flagellin
MSFALDNLTNMNVNVSSAASRIGDTDYADVASEMMKEKIIQAGSMSVLAQANLEPQLVLTVLRQFMN